MEPGQGHAGRPDSVLVDRLRRGDEGALADIYDGYAGLVHGLARRVLRDRRAAEDVTQEVFVALFADLSRYDPARASFSTYLYGIVRNLSRDRLRRERRFLTLDALSPWSDAAAYVDDPADALEHAELAARVRQAFLRLPIRYRELMILCDLHGLSYAEAAEVAKISTAAVRSRLHRGRHLLRQRLSRLARPEPRRPLVSRFALRMLKKPAT